MSFLVVGGVTIPVAPGSNNNRDVQDNVDRSRMFDNSMKVSQSGTEKRIWNFSTPPVARATADAYDAQIGTVASQTCSGDVLGGSVTCYTRRTGWQPVHKSSTEHLVVLSFALDEA